MYEKFIGEGHKVCSDLIKSAKFHIEFIVASETWVINNQDILNDFQEKILLCNNAQMEQISTMKNVSEVLIVCTLKYENLSILLNDPGHYFYLDDLQDPGNVGTIIRTADWFGFKGIISSLNTVDYFNPKVVQASMGSISNLQLIISPASHLETYKGVYNFYGLDMQGKELSTYKFNNNCIIVLGNEGHGLSNDTKALIKEENFINIQGAESKSAESLNVAMAAGILAYHLNR